MEIARFILDVIRTIIWPAIVLGIVFMFRKQIIERFKYLKEFNGGGVKMVFGKNQRKALTEEISAGVSEISTEEKIGIEEKAKLISNFIIEKFQDLPREIEKFPIDVVEPSNKTVGDVTLLAFAVKQSYNENLKYNIYYDPIGRNHNLPFKYIGLYLEGTIIAIGKLNKIIYCNLVDGKLVSTNDENKEVFDGLSTDEYSRIKGIIENTDYYDLDEGLKFFLVDKFYETNFIKASPYPLRAKKYIWLAEIDGYKDTMTTEQLAAFLAEKEWE